MKLILPDRQELENVSWAIPNTLDKIIAKINALWAIEHNDDGTHGAVTADTLTVEGDTTLESDLDVEGLVGPLDFGTASEAIVLDGFIHGPDTREDRSAYPTANVTADDSTPLLRTTRGFAPSADNTKDLGYLSNGSAHRRFRSGYFGSYVEAPVVHGTSAVYERGRADAMGVGIAIAFNAANFTGSGSMTWTVASGDVATNDYTLIGKTLLWGFDFQTTTVGGTPSTTLRVAIPGGFTASKFMSTLCYGSDNGTITTVLAYVGASGTVLNFERQDGANWAAATDATRITGQIAFRIT